MLRKGRRSGPRTYVGYADLVDLADLTQKRLNQDAKQSQKVRSFSGLALSRVTMLLALRLLTQCHLSLPTGSGTEFSVPVERVSTCCPKRSLLLRFAQLQRGMHCLGSSEGPRKLCMEAMKQHFCRLLEPLGLFCGMSLRKVLRQCRACPA